MASQGLNIKHLEHSLLFQHLYNSTEEIQLKNLQQTLFGQTYDHLNDIHFVYITGAYRGTRYVLWTAEHMQIEAATFITGSTP